MPITDLLERNSKLYGDEIALVVVGSGLTWGGILFEVHG